MAHLWFRDAENIWTVMPLDGRAVDVSAYPPRVVSGDFRPGQDASAVLIRAGDGDSVWALLVAGDTDVRVNGFAPVAGLRVIQDRDEIRASLSDSLFFSTETLPHVEEFIAAERAIFCGRCRQPVENRDLSVRCPQCGIVHHQTQKLPCWTYAPHCALCSKSTSLDSEFSFVPEN